METLRHYLDSAAIKVLAGISRLRAPWRAPEYSDGPRQVLIQLTYNCNMRCSFCAQWGDTGAFRVMSGEQLRETLPLSLLSRFIDELPLSCVGVYLWGGETLLYPDLVPLIRHIKRRRKQCALITNGSLLEKHGPALVETGLDTVCVSIDALEPDHDRERGPGAFRKAIDGIRRIRAERQRLSLTHPTILVGSVLLPATVEQLPDLFRELRAAGADRAFLGRLQYNNSSLGKAHTDAFQKLFQIEATSWKGFPGLKDQEAGTRVAAAVEQLRVNPEFREFIEWETPAWKPEHFARYYSDPSFAYPEKRSCRFPWDAICLCPNGDVSPCPDFPDFIVGNIKESSFRGLWNGSRFLEFRRALAANGRFPICTTCCHLYDG